MTKRCKVIKCNFMIVMLTHCLYLRCGIKFTDFMVIRDVGASIFDSANV